MGSFALADSLSREGFDVEMVHLLVESMIDCNFDIVRYVSQNRFDIVCLPLHWHYQAYGVIETTKSIKKACPNIMIVVGGYTASCFAYELMSEYTEVDFVIRGDAEKPLVQLLKTKAAENISEVRLDHIPNLVWRDSGKEPIINPQSYKINQDEIDLLDYVNLSLLKHFEIYLRLPERNFCPSDMYALMDETKFMVNTGRGCPNDCFYCGGGRLAQNIISKRSGYLFRKKEIVVGEIRKLAALGIHHIVFDFDPEPSGRYYIELLTELANFSSRLKCTWASWGLPAKQLIKGFFQSGFRSVELVISPDFGNEAVRRQNKTRHFRNKELLEMLDFFDSENQFWNTKIFVVLYFFIGGPNETEATIKETHELVKKIRKQACVRGVIVQAPQVEPASPISFMNSEYGIDVKRRHFTDYYNLSKQITEEGGDIDYEMLMGFSLENISHSKISKWINNINTVKAPASRRQALMADASDQLLSLEDTFVISPEYEIRCYLHWNSGQQPLRFPVVHHIPTGEQLPLSEFEEMVFNLTDGNRPITQILQMIEEKLAPLKSQDTIPAYFKTIKRFLLNGIIRNREDRHA
jgi:radical SAM superfamily enzyme YgiQ (UPF0313 family)